MAWCTDAKGYDGTGTYTGGRDADGCEVQGQKVVVVVEAVKR